MSSFFDEFSAVLRDVGGEEREQLLTHMPQARRLILDARLASAVYDALNDAPATIERNMDLIVPPQDGILWLELDGYARRKPSERVDGLVAGDDRVAYLVMRHESDPNVLVCAVARKTPDRIGGACYLMPALCAVSLPELAEFAATSRRYFDQERKRSLARMVMMVRTYTPPGIESEIREIGKASKGFDDEKSLLASRGESAPEGVFMVATLLALSATNVHINADDASAKLHAATRPPRSRFAGLFGASSPEIGFVRSGQTVYLTAQEVRPALPPVAA